MGTEEATMVAGMARDDSLSAGVDLEMGKTKDGLPAIYHSTIETAQKNAEKIDKAVAAGEEVQFSGEQLQEFQQMVTLSEEQIRKSMKKEEIAIQEKRLKDLKSLMDLMTQVHDRVNDDQVKQDSISEACAAVIKNTHIARTDLTKAWEYKIALQKKKMWCLIITLILLAIAGVVIYFLVKLAQEYVSLSNFV